MKNYRSGIAAGAIVGIIALVLVIAGIVYWVSDPMRARMQEGIDQMTKWTPENIAKEPVLYLNFCEEQANKAIQSLKADRISVEQNKAKLQEMKDTASAQVKKGEQVLADLKGLYEKAETDKTWPVTWQNQSRDKDTMKAYIMRIYKETQTQRMILDKVDSGLKKLEAQVVKIEKASGDAKAQLADIAANRELLKVQKLTDDLKDRLVNMKGAIQGVVDVAAEGGGLPSLADLAGETTPATDNAEFEKVLTNIK